jgi:hypothetical protein
MSDAKAPGELVSSNKAALAASIRAFAPGERGWIILKEAATLFSPEEIDYAFGELDSLLDDRQKH